MHYFEIQLRIYSLSENDHCQEGFQTSKFYYPAFVKRKERRKLQMLNLQR